MKSKKKIAIWYGVYVLVSMVLEYMYIHTGNIIYGLIVRYIPIVIIPCLILVGIWKSTKDKVVRKKYFIYFGVVAGEITIFILLSKILGISVENTWFGLIGADIIYVTVGVIMFDIMKSKVFKSVWVGFILYIALTILFICLVLTNMAMISSMLR